MTTYTCYVERGHQKVIDGLNNWEYVQDARQVVRTGATVNDVMVLANAFAVAKPNAKLVQDGRYDLFIEDDPNKPNEPIYMFYVQREGK